MKIAKLVEMTSPTRTHNLTNLFRAGLNEVTVGRYSETSDQDVMLAEGSQHEKVLKISRRHALITYDPASQKYFIQDRSSSCGTSIDNKDLEPMEKYALENGDAVRFGGYGPVMFLNEEVRTRLERDTAQNLPKVE